MDESRPLLALRFFVQAILPALGIAAGMEQTDYDDASFFDLIIEEVWKFVQQLSANVINDDLMHFGRSSQRIDGLLYAEQEFRLPGL